MSNASNDSLEQTNSQTHNAQSPTSGQARVRINQRNMTTSYVNGFRAHGASEELFLDVGITTTVPSQSAGDGQSSNQEQNPSVDIALELNHRLIMTYSTAKRLAMMLSQRIQDHEQKLAHTQSRVTGEQNRTTTQPEEKAYG